MESASMTKHVASRKSGTRALAAAEKPNRVSDAVSEEAWLDISVMRH